MNVEYLSDCEENIMNAIWSHDHDLSIPELTDLLLAYGKEYARTTVVTFLIRLSSKGFVETYRKGRLSYAKPLVSKAEYLHKYSHMIVDKWCSGDIKEFLSYYDLTP